MAEWYETFGYLSDDEIAGGLDGEPFRVGSPRCLITTHRST